MLMLAIGLTLSVLLVLVVAYAVNRFDDIKFKLKVPFTELELHGQNPRKPPGQGRRK